MNQAVNTVCQNPDLAAAGAGIVYFIWTTIVRPKIPQARIDQLGKIGALIDALTGNRGTCKNVPPVVADEQNKVTPRP